MNEPIYIQSGAGDCRCVPAVAAYAAPWHGDTLRVRVDCVQGPAPVQAPAWAQDRARRCQHSVDTSTRISAAWFVCASARVVPWGRSVLGVRHSLDLLLVLAGVLGAYNVGFTASGYLAVEHSLHKASDNVRRTPADLLVRIVRTGVGGS